MEFSLIFKKINNTLSAEEELNFNDWYSQSETHRQYFKGVLEQFENNRITVDNKKGWERIDQEIRKKNSTKSYWKYAVAAAIVIAVFSLPFTFKNTPSDLPPTTTLEQQATIEIGSDKATLTLEDGSSVVLQKGEHYEAGHIKSNGEQLLYDSTKTTPNVDLAYNILTIPRGGQFFISLSDGTNVWLNSDSKLRYPVAFAENQTRKVELVYGEAYFEVSPSAKHNGSHFKVSTLNQEIDVIGTEFNIKAYKEDPIISTTLVEGQVVVKSSQTFKKLIPGQQSKLDSKTNSIEISKVDVSNEVSWKNGFFSFKNKQLEEIILVLSRWYDVDFKVQNTEAVKIPFNGVFNKKQEIENILKIIENTNEVKFEIKGKTILVE